MDPVAALAVLVLFALVLALVGLPLRSGVAEAADERERRDIEELEEAKRAKYAEIRELEMDVRTGKLAQEDYREQDRARRAEAVELLRRLDALGATQEALGTVRTARAEDDVPVVSRERT